MMEDGGEGRDPSVPSLDHPVGSERYHKGKTLGEGTYGVVYKATDKVTGEVVAVKKIRLGKWKDGVEFTALREIKLLQELNHPHIIKLQAVYPHKRNLHLVFEFMESDLEAIIKDRSLILSHGDIKAYMQMTLKGLAHCHSKWVLHRDMKPNNLLIGPTGELKLADFGLARIFGSPDAKFTHQVFARWYRSPELLFGSRQYGPGVDIWALGCVFAELLLRRPFLQGETDIDQLGKIFAALGTPSEAEWPDVSTLPDFVGFAPCVAPPLSAHFPGAPPDALELLGRMLALDPRRRLSAAKALGHRYFCTEPAPTPLAQLPRPPVHADKKEGEHPPPSGAARASPEGGGRSGAVVLSPEGQQRRVRGSGGGGVGAGRDGEGEGAGAGERGAHKRQRRVLSMDAARSSLDASQEVGMGGERGKSTGGVVVGTRGAGKLGEGGGVPPLQLGVPGPGAQGHGRPTLSSADRNYLRKRKLEKEFSMEEEQ